MLTPSRSKNTPRNVFSISHHRNSDFRTSNFVITINNCRLTTTATNNWHNTFHQALGPTLKIPELKIYSRHYRFKITVVHEIVLEVTINCCLSNQHGAFLAHRVPNIKITKLFKNVWQQELYL